MKKNWLFILLIVGSQLLLTACSDSGGGKSKKEIPNNTYSDVSCLFQSNEGDDYQKTLAMFNSLPSSFDTTHFGKAFDPRKILPILPASIDAISLFVQKHTSLSLYSVSSDKGACKVLSVLKKLDDPKKMDYWKEINKDSTDKSYIAGVYLNERSSTPFTIIREDSNKYTLVHEYMHFVFDTQRINHGDGKYAEDIKNSFSKSINEASKICSFSCSSDFEKNELVNSLKRLSDDFANILIAFPLEEMTIESLLIAEIQDNNMTQVSESDVLSAHWYISSSAAKADAYIEEIKKFIESRKSDLGSSTSHINSVNQLIKDLNDLQQIVLAYKAKSDQARAKASKLNHAKFHEAPHKTCAHDLDLQIKF